MAQEYRRGTGPKALPQGAATQLNAAQPAALPALDLENTHIPVQYVPGEEDPIPNDDDGLTEDMQVLLSPPDSRYRPRVVPKDRAGRLPRYVVRHLPQLMAAVKDPAAPPTLLALYRGIVRQLEAEMREGGR